MDSVLRNNFAGGRIRKTETNFLKFWREIPAVPEGAGGGTAEFGFGRGAKYKKKTLANICEGLYILAVRLFENTVSIVFNYTRITRV